MVTAWDKALVALIMALLTITELWWGWGGGVNETTVLALLAIFTPIFVYLVPNRSGGTVAS